uniref:Replication-associated protein n=1 Tax=Paspalum striate mosaic virus TaxID=1072672 RepID=J7FHK8_9GEMI|nr:Rep [Paspalum striate mosaic virus]
MSSLVSETSNSEVGSQMESPGRGGQSIDAPSSSCFKVRARNLFLTYSKCNLTAVFLLEYISSLLKKYCPTYIYVAQEAHKDGSHHLHCIVQCSKYVRTTSAKFFDVGEFHPNVQNPRMPKKALAYCKKSPISEAEYGVFQEIKRPRKKNADAPSTKDAKMTEIIKSSTNKEDYLSMVRKTFPFDWATRLQQFQYSAESLFPSTPPPYVDPFGMPSQDEHSVIGAWLRDELYTDRSPAERRRSLYICGPTRTGKTSWARSLGSHNYWQHSVDFLHVIQNAKYNVIDDIPFKFVPCWKGLVGSQKDITVNPKYGKKRLLSNGIPCIILVNEDEDWLQQMQPSQAEWFNANAVVHYMYEGESFFEAL